MRYAACMEGPCAVMYGTTSVYRPRRHQELRESAVRGVAGPGAPCTAQSDLRGCGLTVAGSAMLTLRWAHVLLSDDQLI